VTEISRRLKRVIENNEDSILDLQALQEFSLRMLQ